ncbi:GntR family transcriptional regulator [Klebsiella sp. WP7-S18-CRE-02]|uniref:GntR family transcriptional regulator n=1 Tax=Enterobacteriaceae TaxID=543 RepID=UPI0015DCA3B9|nr:MULTISPECIES: GntR family transcriptional regulator [unclassified Klebsiella]HAT3953414.1 GntR family transcriptional regulator [Kluyvera ascorbata]BBR58078.1 GntR family transcriptional regulator [Klebsiella sp. WP4-W18-ESBL-05]BBS92670.1 GntR family transcriptional regulator [Klebsiella sp. WP7-S18-CRE-02]BBS97699.1 GntR family transcriptional regulator [Klebsiella sp. WP7-S18-CRE-03]BBT02766.1 GntR family transcriptional regulator [Klebsiella sp. WP7-S18-ESBL-04]
MKINKKSKLPMYAQLFEIVTQKINAGELKAGQQLPFERELCLQYEISRTTVRQAMAELEKEGFIKKIHGKGIFVREQAVKQSLITVYSFHEEMMRLNKTPGTTLLHFSLTSAPTRIAQKLNTENPVYHIIRLRSADYEPILYEETYLTSVLFPELTQEDIETCGLYNAIKEKYNISVRRAIDTFRAINIKPDIARHLNETPGAPGLQIERIAFLDNTPIEYTVEIARGSQFEYTIELQGVTLNSSITAV